MLKASLKRLRKYSKIKNRLKVLQVSCSKRPKYRLKKERSQQENKEQVMLRECIGEVRGLLLTSSKGFSMIERK